MRLISAMLTQMFLKCLRDKKVFALGACIGPAILIGFISATVSNLALSLKASTEIDDTLDVFPCHDLGSLVAMLLTGVFANDVGLIFGETKTFYCYLSFVSSVLAYFILLVILQADAIESRNRRTILMPILLRWQENLTKF